MIRRRVLNVLLGVYLALLVVPAALMVGVDGIVGSYLAVAVTGVGIAGVGALAARSVGDLVDRLCSDLIAFGVICLPLIYLPYMIFATDPGSTAEIAAAIGVAAVVPGSVALFVASHLRIRQLHERSTEIVAVTVGDPESSAWRQFRLAAAAVSGIALIGAGVATLLIGSNSFATLTGFLGGLSALLLLIGDDSTEITVTTNGLQVNQSVTIWEDLDGYRLTDDSIEIVRSRRFFPTQEFDREAINDEEVLLNGISTYLPRLNEAGERMDDKVESYC